MTKEEKQKALYALKKSAPIMTMTPNEFADYIKTLNKMADWLEQEPKTGHWIMPLQDDGMSDSIYYQVRCSECGFDIDPQLWFLDLHKYDADKYCPKCGAKMIEEQESEDKE